MKWNESNGKQDQVCDDSFVHVCVPFVGFSIACWGRAFRAFTTERKDLNTKGKSFILNREVRKEHEDSLNAKGKSFIEPRPSTRAGGRKEREDSLNAKGKSF